MIVVYAQGGGLGHLTRARAALHTLGRTEPVTFLTSSPFASDHRIVGDATVSTVPAALARDRSALRAFMRQRLGDLAPTELVVDAFPYGIAGELDATIVPAGTNVWHLARLLRWDVYTGVAPTPSQPIRFDQTFVVEPLHPDHEAALGSLSRRSEVLTLVDPPAPASTPVAVPGAWLVVHAGTDDETAQLVAYAEDEARAEAVRPEVVIVRDHPAWPHFAAAGRVFTGAGFNAMRQLAGARDRHRFLPFPRRFDDQFERARRARVDAGT